MAAARVLYDMGSSTLDAIVQPLGSSRMKPNYTVSLTVLGLVKLKQVILVVLLYSLIKAPVEKMVLNLSLV